MRTSRAFPLLITVAALCVASEVVDGPVVRDGNPRMAARDAGG